MSFKLSFLLLSNNSVLLSDIMPHVCHVTTQSERPRIRILLRPEPSLAGRSRGALQQRVLLCQYAVFSILC